MTLCELFSDESRWIKVNAAVDKDGMEVAPTDPRACAWCLSAGIQKLFGPDKERLDRVLRRVDKAIADLFGHEFDGEATPSARVIDFNDRATFVQVQRVAKIVDDINRIYGVDR